MSCIIEYIPNDGPARQFLAATLASDLPKLVYDALHEAGVALTGNVPSVKVVVLDASSRGLQDLTVTLRLDPRMHTTWEAQEKIQHCLAQGLCDWLSQHPQLSSLADLEGVGVELEFVQMRGVVLDPRTGSPLSSWGSK